jgi:hypothetical protein
MAGLGAPDRIRGESTDERGAPAYARPSSVAKAMAVKTARQAHPYRR